MGAGQGLRQVPAAAAAYVRLFRMLCRLVSQTAFSKGSAAAVMDACATCRSLTVGTSPQKTLPTPAPSCRK